MVGVRELRKQAVGKGIKGYWNMRKPELLKALNRPDEAKQAVKESRSIASAKTANTIAKKLASEMPNRDPEAVRAAVKGRLLRAVKKEIDAARKANPNITPDELRKVAGNAFVKESQAVKKGEPEKKGKAKGQEPKVTTVQDLEKKLQDSMMKSLSKFTEKKTASDLKEGDFIFVPNKSPMVMPVSQVKTASGLTGDAIQVGKGAAAPIFKKDEPVTAFKSKEDAKRAFDEVLKPFEKERQILKSLTSESLLDAANEVRWAKKDERDAMVFDDRPGSQGSDKKKAELEDLIKKAQDRGIAVPQKVLEVLGKQEQSQYPTGNKIRIDGKDYSPAEALKIAEQKREDAKAKGLPTGITATMDGTAAMKATTRMMASQGVSPASEQRQKLIARKQARVKSEQSKVGRAEEFKKIKTPEIDDFKSQKQADYAATMRDKMLKLAQSDPSIDTRHLQHALNKSPNLRSARWILDNTANRSNDGIVKTLKAEMEKHKPKATAVGATEVKPFRKGRKLGTVAKSQAKAIDAAVPLAAKGKSDTYKGVSID